ncbi:MAG: bifunctional adenosylcobinamide kinase/adenosylcobinamide-phosphate guanylyltransferase [Alphaproteobacteria bacterium]
MSSSGKHILVLGGARSGKSTYAESLADGWKGQRVFIATAQAHDEEMAARIKAHRERRGKEWTTVGALLDLPGALREAASENTFILIDCLTLWLTNVMLAEQDCGMAVSELIDALSSAPGAIILVSNEVGSGIVPGNALARRFRDVAGEANQRVAQEVDEVVLVTAGLPMVLKSST